MDGLFTSFFLLKNSYPPITCDVAEAEQGSRGFQTWEQLREDIMLFTAQQINDALQRRTGGAVCVPAEELMRRESALPLGVDSDAMKVVELFEHYTIPLHSAHPAARRIPFAVQLPLKVQINDEISSFSPSIVAKIFDIIQARDEQWPKLEIADDVPSAIKEHVVSAHDNLVALPDQHVKRTDYRDHAAHREILKDYFGESVHGYNAEGFLAELSRLMVTGDYSKLDERRVMFEELNEDGDPVLWRARSSVNGYLIRLSLEAPRFSGAGTTPVMQIKNKAEADYDI